MLAYGDPIAKSHLFYWRRSERNSQAEVDYLIQMQENVVPIEVKSGEGSTLRSMHLFLEGRPSVQYGIRFSIQNYSTYEKIRSYPLYTVARLFFDAHETIREALLSLVADENSTS